MRFPALITAVGAVLLLGLSFVSPARSQSFLDQEKIERVLNGNHSELEDIPVINYSYHVLWDSTGSNILARNWFYKAIGDGDPKLGQNRALLVEILNRKLLQDVIIGDTLVVPHTFDQDFRAYSPFPWEYEGARDLDKLFIIDKGVQAFAAYENGHLVRWGMVNTGAAETPTPSGRFNFNWQEDFKVSELSPEEESWDMYWVFNFHDKRGIHVHQYAFPTGGPMSHGCVRLVDADARWIYEWADTWQTKGGGINYASSGKPILKQGTMVLVIGEEPPGYPKVFEDIGSVPVLKIIDLPESPYDVPPGTDQQKYFDRLRRQGKAS